MRITTTVPCLPLAAASQPTPLPERLQKRLGNTTSLSRSNGPIFCSTPYLSFVGKKSFTYVQSGCQRRHARAQPESPRPGEQNEMARQMHIRVAGRLYRK